MTDLEALEALAKKATPLEWELKECGYSDNHGGRGSLEIWARGEELFELGCPCANCSPSLDALGPYIAAANPQTILELFSRLREAERSVEHVRYWYGTRWEKLRELCKEAGVENEACAIMANGSRGPGDPPTFAQMYNALQGRLREVKRQRDELRGLLRAILDAYDDEDSIPAADAFPYYALEESAEVARQALAELEGQDG